MLLQVVVSFSKYSPWHLARLSSAGTSLHHCGGRRRRSCFVLQFPTGCLIAIPANCPNASRRVVNDWDCNGSCHLKFFDHPRKPIKSVARLQFAGGHIGQFRENDRRIIHSVWYFKSPPVGSESSDLESATKAVYFAFRNSAKAQDAYAYFLYHQPLGPLMNHVAIPICTARMPSRECHLDTSRKRCDMTYRDPNPLTAVPQKTANGCPAGGQT